MSFRAGLSPYSDLLSEPSYKLLFLVNALNILADYIQNSENVNKVGHLAIW